MMRSTAVSIGNILKLNRGYSRSRICEDPRNPRLNIKRQEMDAMDAMKSAIGCFLTTVFLAACFTALPGWAADETKIAVLNPRGIQPPIRRIPMATRPDTLDGKTIYIVDTKFPQTREFVEELAKILRERYPKTTWVIKDKFGNYMDDDPKLWAETKEKAQGAIVVVGH